MGSLAENMSKFIKTPRIIMGILAYLFRSTKNKNAHRSEHLLLFYRERITED